MKQLKLTPKAMKYTIEEIRNMIKYIGYYDLDCCGSSLRAPLVLISKLDITHENIQKANEVKDDNQTI